MSEILTALAGEGVLPEYGRASICEVPHLALRCLGLPNRCPDTLAEGVGGPYRRVVLLILDALGWNQLQAYADRPGPTRELLDASHAVPLTSTFPSTTTVALTSLYTGLTPVQHGVLGHYVYLRELGGIVDILRFSPRDDPRPDACTARGADVNRLFPMQTVFQPVREAGFATISLTRKAFFATSLGRLHHPGAELEGYVREADMAVRLRRLLRERPEPGLLVAYWDDVDVLSHEYGPFSEEVRSAVSQFLGTLVREVLDELSAEEREGTLLLITADHGQTDTHYEEAIFPGEHPALLDRLMLPPSGQTRAPYFHAWQGEQDRLRTVLETFAPRLTVAESGAALDAGLFGPLDPHAPEYAAARRRLGEFVGVSHGGSQLAAPEASRMRLMTRGRHGGLSENEMRVPLLALPLSEWRS
jgi:hypothetical protein